jgi:hypothetical protein
MTARENLLLRLALGARALGAADVGLTFNGPLVRKGC